MNRLALLWTAVAGLALTTAAASAPQGHQLDCSCNGSGGITYDPDGCVVNLAVGWSIWDGACLIYPVCNPPAPCAYDTTWYAEERNGCDVTFELKRDGNVISTQLHTFDDEEADAIGCESSTVYQLCANGHAVATLTLVCRDCLASSGH